jgi:DNA segregation ATPase FtsK/SpoIIIE-like protein
VLEENARLLEGVLDDFGVRGEIINVRPGPVVTLYELEPAPGIKSSRVISLADDIARSMSAIAARVAVIPGRNVIGIELPNQTRETVFLRELIGSTDFDGSKAKLALTAGQDHRRRAGHRRPRQDAASAGRRHHRLRQVGGHQHHDPRPGLPAHAGAVPASS